MNNNDSNRSPAESKSGTVCPVLSSGSPSPDDVRLTLQASQRLVHELQVHQADLMAQNEELRRIQLSLEDSRAEWADLYHTAPVGYCTVNAAGHITQANQTLASMLEVARSRLLGRALSSFVLPKDQDLHYIGHQRTGNVPYELHLIKGDGTPMWSLLTVANTLGSDGQRLQHFTVNDITMRLKVEEALRYSEVRWKFAIEGAGHGLWDWHILTGKAFYSPRYKAMLGFAEDDFGDSADEWSSRIHPYDAPGVFAELQPYMDGMPGTAEFEFRMRCKDGSWKWILTRGMVIEKNAQGRPMRMICTNADISLERESAEALQQALHDAREANNGKSRFLAAASHDLRQPISALTLYAGMLGNAVKPGHEDLALNIQACVENVGNMITGLLDLSTLDAGAIVPVVTVFDSDQFCSSLRSVYEAKAAQKKLSLRCRHIAPPPLQTDRRMLHQLVGNLVDNAISYTPQGGGVLMAIRRSRGKLWFEVWDTGVGMEQDQIPHIFDEFTQLANTSRSRAGGLGLSIVAKMAKLLGLQMRVQSRRGLGSMFAVELPESTQLAITKPEVAGASDRFKIGVVEDNPLVLGALVLTLKELGHKVFGGSCWTELLNALGRVKPDLVISDYLLGDGQTGLDVRTSARAQFGSKLPVIILTAETDPDLVGRMAAKNVAVYAKPVTASNLEKYIQLAIPGRR